VASFRSLFRGIYAETFVLLAHLVQIATKFTKRAFLKDVLSSKNGCIKRCISLIKATMFKKRAFTKNNFKPIWKFEYG
jgi:hypothetical protein